MSLTRHDLVDLDEDLDDVAAGWFALQRSGMDAQDAAELDAWLARDPDHRAAFEACARAWSGVEALRAHPRMLALRERALKRRRRVRLRPPVWATAASLALAVGAGAWLAASTGVLSAWFARPIEQQFSTSVGQRTTVTLPDGSLVTLDTDTLVRTRESRGERRVELDHGQAFFRVAKDAARPFVVSAGGKTVTATGTQFDVRLDPRLFAVTLVQGRVRVEAPITSAAGGRFGAYVQSTDMAAGSRLVALPNQQWTISRVDLARETSWLKGQLVYEAAPLGAVAAELNRYSDKKIVVRGARLAARPISGTFRTGDVDGFVRILRHYRLVRVAADSEAKVELAAR